MQTIVPKDSGLEVKKVSTFEGHDGQGYNCDLYYKGKRVAHAHEAAYGGGPDIHWEDVKARQEIEDNIKSYLPYRFETGTLDADIGLVIEELVTVHIHANNLRKALKSKLLYALGGKIYYCKGDPEDKIARELLIARHKAEILNDMPFEEALDKYISAINEGY